MKCLSVIPGLLGIPISLMGLMPAIGLASPSMPQPTPQTILAQASFEELNQQLYNAVEAKAWRQAIQIVDQMLRIAPERQAELKAYRARLSALAQQASGSEAIPPARSPSIGTKPTLVYDRPPGLTRCGANPACFIQAAKTCSPTTLDLNQTFDMFGIAIQIVGRSEIWGRQRGQCVQYSQVQVNPTGFTDQGRRQALARGVTQAEIDRLTREFASKKMPPFTITCEFRQNQDLADLLAAGYGQTKRKLGGQGGALGTQGSSRSSITLDGREVGQCEYLVPETGQR